MVSDGNIPPLKAIKRERMREGAENVKKQKRKILISLLILCVGLVLVIAELWWTESKREHKAAVKMVGSQQNKDIIVKNDSSKMEVHWTDTEVENTETENLETENTEAEDVYHKIYLSDILVRIDDKAHMLSEDEIDQIFETAKSNAEEKDETIIVVTTSDSFGKTSMEFADDYYDDVVYDESYGKVCTDGYLILINMAERKCYISTSGEVIKKYTDEKLNENLDMVYPYLAEGDYETAIINLIENAP